MLAFPATFRVFLATDAVDMRKQYDGLWAEVVNRLHEDPIQGAVFAFTNKNRNRLKLLYWDGSGMVVLAKRLEQGRFTWITRPGESKVQLTADALSMILAGIDLQKTAKKAWFRKNNA